MQKIQMGVLLPEPMVPTITDHKSEKKYATENTGTQINEHKMHYFFK